MRHALRYALASDRIDDHGPGTRLLILGPDRAGNLLELVVAGFDGDDPLVIHAMPMQSRYLDLLRRHAH